MPQAPKLRALRAVEDAPATSRCSSEDVEARARSGDVAAWATLYEDAYRPVYRQVCYLTGDGTLAEDLTQEAFASAFSSISEFGRHGAFVGWVRGIALNLVRMHWRRQASSARAHEKLERLHEVTPPSLADDPDGQQQRRARVVVLYEVLAELPEHLREVLVLRDIEGLPAREVGEMLGITANNVGVRANRARTKIREGLRQRGWLDTQEGPQ